MKGLMNSSIHKAVRRRRRRRKRRKRRRRHFLDSMLMLRQLP